jgi:hypothetical protein
MKKKSIWFGSAAALILFACWLLMQSGSKPQSEGEMTGKPKSARAASNDEDLARERSARRKASGRVLPEGSITTHQPEQLKDFVLTECKGHQVSLRTALKLIDEAYQDACYFSLEKPLKLKYEIDGESDKLLNFSLKGKTWLGAVTYVAALAGMEAKLECVKVVLTPLEGADEVTEMSLKINPSLIDDLQKSLIDLGELELTATSDPSQLSELLRKNGIISQAAVSYNAAQGILTMHGNEQECAALEAFVSLSDGPPEQFKTVTKLIITKNPLEISKNTLSPTELEELMRQLSQQKGTALVTAPSVMSLSGQEALIEIKQGMDDQWTGLELKYNTTYIGLKLASANQTEIRPKDGKGENQRAEMQLLVYDGDSQITNIGTDDLGNHYQITTIQRIDATGRLLKQNILFNRSGDTEITREDIDALLNNPNRNAAANASSPDTTNPPVAKAVPGKPGFVFSPFNNHIIDLTGIAPGTLVADPQYPASEKKHFRAP